MPGLCDLPDEIILLSFTTTYVLKCADLAALALSCRRLKAVAESVLYQVNKQYWSSSAVHWAAAQGYIPTLDKALKHGLDIDLKQGLDIDQKSTMIVNPTGLSPLQIAVHHGQSAAVVWLLDHGADVTQEVNSGSECGCGGTRTSILHMAICLGHSYIAQLLISRGAPLEYDIRVAGYFDLVRESTDALVDASFHGRDTVVEMLVKEYGMDLKTPHGSWYESNDVLACAAHKNSNVSTIRTLVALGANVDGIHKQWERSPLSVAIRKGNFAVAHTLIDLGANITSYEYDMEIEDEEGSVIETLEVEAAPLHDTVASVPENEPESWQDEKVAFMHRLIKLGIDIDMGIDMEIQGQSFSRRFQSISPLGLATSWGDVQDMRDLIALGAKLQSSMLLDAWEADGTNDRYKKGFEKVKLLLQHGARLDEKLRKDMSLLQWLIDTEFEPDIAFVLHEILLMSSPKNLASGHLDDVLAECLGNRHCNASIVLIRHGARVSCKDKLFSRALNIAGDLEFHEGRVDDLDDIDEEWLYSDQKARDCMRIIIDLGLSRADQCLILQDVLCKRQLALTHLFLDRGLPGTPEAVKYLPGLLMEAASSGTTCVIKVLWRHTHEASDPTFRLLLARRAIISNNREAVSFFLDQGVTPFEHLTPTQFRRVCKSSILSIQVRRLVGKGFSLTTMNSSDGLWVERESKKAQIVAQRYCLVHPSQGHSSPLQLAVQYGHIDIVSDILERVNQADTDAISRCGKIYVPGVLEKANEIQEMIQKKGIECESGNSYAT